MKALYLFTLSLVIACSSSNQLDHQTIEKDNEFINYLFKNYNGDLPGASVIVIKNNRIEFVKSYGFADLENKIIASPKTNYRIASVTKQFTATAIMILIKQGKLTYETTLTEIFPQFPKYGKDITIQHLLTHRSGLVKYNLFIEKDNPKQMLDKDVLNGLLETDSTYFTPNTKYAYSNTGYAILAQVIEKVTQKSFDEFVKTEIFGPLKMKNSLVYEAGQPIKKRAYGYMIKKDEITRKDQSKTSAIQGDGGIYTSVIDYYKWDQALYTDQLLTPKEFDKAFYNYDENGKSETEGYGFGWLVNYENGIKILQHGGSSTGFGSHVIRVPSQNISIAIFTNRNKKGHELANKAKAILHHYSQGLFKMPFEIVLEKEIDLKGIEIGIKKYHEIKKDTFNYSITKGALFNFGINYINADENEIALHLFTLLENEYPHYFGGYFGKAVAYKKMNQKEKAITYFRLTIEHATENEKWAIGYAQTKLDDLLRE